MTVIYPEDRRHHPEPLDELNEGDCLHDFVGPLGVPTEVPRTWAEVAACVGGGVGCAIAYARGPRRCHAERAARWT